MSELSKLKIILEISESDTSKDILLEVLIADVEDFLRTVTNNEILNNSLVRRIVIIRYNQLGSEGLSSESYSGASQSFLNELPLDIVREINKMRKLVF